MEDIRALFRAFRKAKTNASNANANTRSTLERKIFRSAIYAWLAYDISFRTAFWYAVGITGGNTLDLPESKELMTLFRSFANEIPAKNIMLGRQLGSGTYGSVLLVNYDNKIYAYKAQPVNRQTVFGSIPAVLEFALLTSLSHKNIVTCQGFNYDGCTLNLLIEYYPYTLEQKIYEDRPYTRSAWKNVMKRRQFFLPLIPITIRERIAKQLRSVLQYIHGKGVLHLDLKPDNIIVNDAFEIKLIDFGLACINYHKRAYPFCTTDLTPPELTSNHIREAILSYKIDYWQAGLILLEMEIGVPVFWCKRISELKHQHQRLPSRKFVITANCQNITNLLQFDPASRTF